MNSNSLSVILPVYNEEENIEDVVNSISVSLPKFINEFEVILVNDGSNDKTAVIIDRLVKGKDYIKVFHHSINMGYGSALRSGFKLARYPVILFMDSDGQFDISEINNLIGYIDEFDIVIGARISRSDSLYRVFIGWCYNKLACLLLNIKVKDITCGFKLIKKIVIDSIDLKSKEGFINAELLVNARNKGYRIKEVGINHFPRSRGKQSGVVLKVFMVKIFELFSFWVKMKLNREKISREQGGIYGN